MKLELNLILLVLSINSATYAQQSASHEQFKAETLQLAKQWVQAYNDNSKMDLEKFMSLHHPDLQYYWHGKPMDYKGWKYVLKEYIIAKEQYNNALYDPVITVIDYNNAVIGFQIGDKNIKDAERNAVSLVVTRTNEGLKIIHIHESDER